jgi:hypothetical protein
MKIVLVALIVAAPLTITLLEAHSVGPVAYEVYDSDAYVAIQDGLQHQSIHGAQVTKTPNKDLVQNLYSSLMEAAQETEMSPLAANLNELLGFHATDTQSAYLIALLVAGGLGMFATICFALGSVSWWAIFGGGLFGGAFCMQLFFDGSEGAICGLIVLLPLATLGVIAARSRRLRDLLPATIVFAALFALYPVFLDIVGATAAVAVVVFAVQKGVLRNRGWREIAANVAKLLIVVVLAIPLDFIGFLRAIQVWRHLLQGGLSSLGFPQYNLAVRNLPGWLFQITDFYSFSITPQSNVDIFAAIIVPTVIAVVVFPGLRRNRLAWLVLPGIAVAALGGAYQIVKNACSYCEDRNLLPLGIFVMFLVGLGVAVLAKSHVLWRRGAALAVLLLATASMGYSAYNESSTYSSGSYFLPASVRSVFSHLPSHAGVVDVEGFDLGPKAPAELPFVYDMVYEATNDQVSVPADQAGDPGLAYVYLHPLNGPVFDPSYRYVLTRIPSVSTGRRIIASAPGVALEERVDALDVTVDTGLNVPLLPSQDPTGATWVVAPVHFVISGPSSAPPVLRYGLALPAGMSATDLQQLSRMGTIDMTTLTFNGCVATVGSSRIHTVTVNIPPNLGVRLTSMRAYTGSCAVPKPS